MNIRNFYSTLSIKWKLIAILSVFVILISTISLSAIKVTNHVYDKQLLNLSSKMLNLYTTSIENELRKMEKLTFSFLTEVRTQDNLEKINTISSSYDRFQAIYEVRTKLLAVAQSERYISSISYFDLMGSEYTVGNSVTIFNKNYLERIKRKLDDSSGEITWIEPMEGDSSFVVARKLRTVGQLKAVGYIVIRINPDWLVEWVSSTWPDFRGELLIYTKNGNEIYKDPSLEFLSFSPELLEKAAYNVRSIEENKYLITEVYSKYTSWSYYTLVSYENIFNSILVMRISLIIAFIILIIIIFMIGVKFSGSITKPIIMLSTRMKEMDKEAFELTNFSIQNQPSGDEIAQLNNDFVFMINKVKMLIKENYVKQLLIKEAELKALQAQINPHFLYNTLESINWEAKVNKQSKIAVMVKALGGMLRKATQNSNHITSIGEELKLVEDYITIQSFRYEDRLEFDCNCADNLRGKSIVKMSLQPIIENSIKYGLERKAGICKIEVNIESNGDYIEINISDNGPGIGQTDLLKLRQGGYVSSTRSGIGLKNIDERLKLTFGDQYGLLVDSNEQIGTCVTLKIPNKEVTVYHVQGISSR